MYRTGDDATIKIVFMPGRQTVDLFVRLIKVYKCEHHAPFSFFSYLLGLEQCKLGRKYRTVEPALPTAASADNLFEVINFTGPDDRPIVTQLRLCNMASDFWSFVCAPQNHVKYGSHFIPHFLIVSDPVHHLLHRSAHVVLRIHLLHPQWFEHLQIYSLHLYSWNEGSALLSSSTSAVK